MPPALSPAGRLRSRTSDISDLLRGRHDAKTSTDSQLPPPIPSHLAEPVTPTKSKGKFSFLGRKRKPSSVSPSSARIANDAARKDNPNHSAAAPPLPTGTAVDASTSQLPHGTTTIPSPNKATPGSLPQHSNASPPSLASMQTEGNASRAVAPTPPLANQKGPSGIPTSTLRSIRAQKSTSFEHSRQSNDSQARKQSSSSSRPIITISPPHNLADGADTFHQPRSAPRPPGQRRPSQSGLPTPSSAPALHDRAGGPDSPTSDASSATSIQSAMHFPIPSADGPLTATSYKEESLLRKDHFEIGAPERDAQSGQFQARRGTVSGANQSAPSSVGRSALQDRQQRRHVSVLHLNKLKQEVVAATATPPRVRRSGRHSDSGTSGNESTASSQGTVSGTSRTTTTSSLGKKVPPPLPRTWHTPPTTGPPTEPLPSPPASATLQPLILSSSARSSASSPPVSPQSARPPPLPPKDAPGHAQGTKSPESVTLSLSDTMPPSPARSERDSSPARTPVREDAVKRLLADESASAEELRAALKAQAAKYARLMSYLLTLTERHGIEKHEFARRIEVLEQDARRRERELKGLRWLVANASQSGGAAAAAAQRHAGGPARADSGTLPAKEVRSRARACSESVASPTVGTSMRPRSGTHESAGRMSIDSPAGSTEEGLFEVQTSIAEFIAPLVSPPLTDEEPTSQRSSLSPTARLRRSNTLPDGLSVLPLGSSKQRAQKQKQARRTSSPVLPMPSAAASPGPGKRPSAVADAHRSGATKAGLGIDVLGVLQAVSGSEPASPLSEYGGGNRGERDPHARSDSSTLSSLPSLATLHTASSGLSSIPETPRTEAEFPLPAADASAKKQLDAEDRERAFRRQSTSSLASSTSSSAAGASSRASVSASPSIGQVLDRSRQPEMDAILRKLRAFGHHGSP